MANPVQYFSDIGEMGQGEIWEQVLAEAFYYLTKMCTMAPRRNKTRLQDEQCSHSAEPRGVDHSTAILTNRRCQKTSATRVVLPEGKVPVREEGGRHTRVHRGTEGTGTGARAVDQALTSFGTIWEVTITAFGPHLFSFLFQSRFTFPL